ncbi:MAG: DUF3256 family protein [Muribaculaceae bacterium]|nr:DUF3256 family protein [Muribaculaceae bacterium]
MRSFIVIVLFTITLGSLNARITNTLFSTDSAKVFSLLSPDARFDIIEYYKADSIINMDNRLGGQSKLIKVADDFLAIKMTDVSTIEMWISDTTEMKSDVVVVNKTLLTPVPDGSLSFFNNDWKELDSKKYIQPITIADFIRIPKDSKKKINDIVDLIDLPFISFSISPDNGDIIASQNLEKYLSKEDYAKLKPFLIDSIKLKWTGKKYKKEK